MFTTQATLERRAAKEHRLVGIEERLATMAADLKGLKYDHIHTEECLTVMGQRTATVEAKLSDVSCSMTSRNDTMYQLADSNRNLVRQVQEINARIDDVLQRMIVLKADIDKVAATPTPTQSVTGTTKFGGGSTASKFALPAKKASAATDDN